MEAVTHGPAADTHRQHQIVPLLLRFLLQIAQTAQQAFTGRLGYRCRIDIPAAGRMSAVNVRLEIAPRIEKGRFVGVFIGLARSVFDGVLLFAFVTDDPQETENDFVIGGRRYLRQIIAAAAVSGAVIAL